MSRIRVRRLPEKSVPDVEVLHAILDAALVAHVAVVEEGQPHVLPMACARDGDRLLLHGSTGSRVMRQLTAGAPTCVTVTLLDGLGMARSAFNSSMKLPQRDGPGEGNSVLPARNCWRGCEYSLNT